MKPLADIAREDLTPRFTEVYKSVSELKEYLERTYGLTSLEISQNIEGNLNLDDIGELLKKLEKGVYETIRIQEQIRTKTEAELQEEAKNQKTENKNTIIE